MGIYSLCGKLLFASDGFNFLRCISIQYLAKFTREFSVKSNVIFSLFRTVKIRFSEFHCLGLLFYKIQYLVERPIHMKSSFP